MSQGQLDLPIVFRKGISHLSNILYQGFFSYERLSLESQASIISLLETKIQKSIQTLVNPTWRLIVQEEMGALGRNDTWEILKLLKGKRTVGFKWIFAVKYNVDRIINRYKARFVAIVCTQTYGTDY